MRGAVAGTSGCFFYLKFAFILEMRTNMENNIDLSVPIPSSVSGILSSTVVLVISVLIIAIILMFKRWRARFMPFLMGILSGGIAIVIGSVIMTLLTSIPGMEESFSNNGQAYAILYYIFVAAAMTLTRYVTFSTFGGKYERQGDILISGLGFSMADSVIFLVSTMYYVIWANVDLSTVFSDISAENAGTVYSSVSTLMYAPPAMWMLLGISIIIDIIVNIALGMVIFGYVKKAVPTIWIFISAIIEFATLIAFQPMQMIDYTSAVAVYVSFAIKAVISAAAILYIFKVTAKEIVYSED